jgi:SOS response associated peptidase (SRAP)/Terminase large subunit, T4likevirus-type, N-terminal
LARRQGAPDALDSVIVKQASGGNSTLGFKPYDRSRTKWQAETLDFVWFDEKPPQDVYIEGLTRLVLYASPLGRRKPINAKAETVAELPTFRDAFAQRRCIVPVDGFFEWRSAGP